MTRAELLKLAEAVAFAEERIYWFNVGQTPTDPVERIKRRAQFKIAQSQLQKASEEYNAAINSHSGEELSEIMKGES